MVSWFVFSIKAGWRLGFHPIPPKNIGQNPKNHDAWWQREHVWWQREPWCRRNFGWRTDERIGRVFPDSRCRHSRFSFRQAWRTQFFAYVYKDLFKLSPNLLEWVVQSEEVEQVMNVGFLNLAKKVSLTWISKAAKDEWVSIRFFFTSKFPSFQGRITKYIRVGFVIGPSSVHSEKRNRSSELPSLTICSDELPNCQTICRFLQLSRWQLRQGCPAINPHPSLTLLHMQLPS
jgi:hypothetical protein